MSNQDDPAEVERLRLRPAQLEARPSKSGGGFSGGFFGCFGVLAAIVVLVAVLAAMGQCSGKVASTTPSSAATSAAASAATSTSSPTDPWVYSSTTDALNDAQTKTACTTSTNQISQSFPYHDTSAQLCLRHSRRNGLDAYVSLDRDGQILCGIDSCTIPVRFDKGQLQHFPGVGAKDNSTNIVFINRTASLVADLKKSSGTVIELTLFQNGNQTLTFNTAGLKWP